MVEFANRSDPFAVPGIQPGLTAEDNPNFGFNLNRTTNVGGLNVPSNILGIPGFDDPRTLQSVAGALQGFLQGGQQGGLGEALLGGAVGGFGGLAQGQQQQVQRQDVTQQRQAQQKQQIIQNARATRAEQLARDKFIQGGQEFEQTLEAGAATEQRLLTKDQREAVQQAADLDIRNQQLVINRQGLQTPLIRTLESSGIDPQSPEGRAMVERVLTKPLIQQGAKPPAGFRFTDPEDRLSTLEAIPGGPADRMSPEAAAKFQLMAQGATDVESARQMIFNKDGSINRKVLAQANAPFGAVPGTDGVLLKSLMRTAIEAQLRAESGAAVPEAEVERAMARFMPSVFDNKKTANSKIDRLEGLLAGSLEASGREAAPTTQATLLEQQQGQGGIIPQAQAGAPSRPTTEADFNALPSGSVFINPSDGRTLVKN